MAVNKRLSIQEYIRIKLDVQEYPRVSYSPAGAASIPQEGGEDILEKPQSVIGNENTVSFADSSNFREFSISESFWDFSFKMHFTGEVSVHEVVLSKFSEIPRIELLDKVYKIVLRSMKHSHPPRQGATKNGTVVDLEFRVSPMH